MTRSMSATSPVRWTGMMAFVREVIAASRDAMITAFATAKLFVVLPLLIEQSKELLHRHQLVNTGWEQCKCYFKWN